MCAINGITWDDLALVEKMCLANKSRGPDYTASYYRDGVSFGHNLLAISGDPIPSAQPRVTKNSVLVYNGELYDVDAEKELDTDYLQRHLEFKGVKAVRGLNGAFAFAWLSKGILYLVRDHFGQKPLYYARLDGKLIYSSTIFGIIEGGVKPLFSPKNIEDFQLGNYWQNGQKTVYSNIFKLAPGQIMKYDVEKQSIIGYESCWDGYTIGQKKFNHFEYRGKVLEGVLRTARTNKRLALLHSGGLDSNLLAAILGISGPENFFSATLAYEDDPELDPDPYYAMMNEAHLAAICTKEYDIEHIIAKMPASQELIDRYSKRCMEISGSIFEDSYRMVPRLYLLEEVAKQGAKVVLTGDGGDEIFSGYNKHGDWLNPKVQANLISRTQRRPQHHTVQEYIKEHELESWFPLHVIEGVHPITAQMFIDLLTGCETYLLRADAFCGAFGMESRTPFLYQDLVKYVLEIPLKRKLQYETEAFRGINKFLIREVFQDLIPREIAQRAGKVGWSLPYWRKDPEIRKRRMKKDQRMLEQVVKENSDGEQE